MNKYALFAVVALVALQGVCARPRSAKPEEKSTQLEELAQKAQVLVNNVTETLGLKDLPDSKKVVEVLNTNAQNLANTVSEAVEKLKAEVKAHQPEMERVLKQVEERLTETAASLQKAAGPEVTKKAKELKTNLDNSLKTTVAEVEKLVKAVEPDATKVKNDIQDVVKTLLDQVVEVSNNIQQQVKATVADHQKTHTH